MLDRIEKLIGELSDKLKASEIGAREIERQLLEIIGQEIDEDHLDRPCWLAAFAESEGNPDKAKALYIKHRLQRLMDELAAYRIRNNYVKKNTVEKNRPVYKAKDIQPVDNKNSQNLNNSQNIHPRAFLIFVPILAIIIFAMILGSSNVSSQSDNHFEEDIEQDEVPSGQVVDPPLASSEPTMSYDNQNQPFDAYPQTLPTPMLPQEDLPFTKTEQTFKTSFNCFAAHLSAEREICENDVLARKDIIMADLYEQLLGSRSGLPRLSLTESQENWLRVRNQCDSDSCNSAEYDSRIDQLKIMSKSFDP